MRALILLAVPVLGGVRGLGEASELVDGRHARDGSAFRRRVPSRVPPLASICAKRR